MALSHLITDLAFNAINGVETIDIENLEIHDGTVPSINKSAQIKRKFNFDESELKKRLSKTEFEVTQEVQWEDRNKGRYISQFMSGTYHCVVCKTAIFDSKVNQTSKSIKN